MLPLRVSGDLRDVDPALLVRSLSRSRETGRLAVTDGEVTRNLFFKSGDLLFATSNDPDDALGAHLLKSGHVGFEALGRAAAQVTPERRLGAVLIDEGQIGPEELVEVVSRQLLAIVHAVLRMSRGRYFFDFSDMALREMIVLRRDPRAILLEGLRRVESVTRVSRGLKQLAGRNWRVVAPETAAALELAPIEEQVLKLLPEPWAGDPLPSGPDLNPWEVARAVWALTLVGLIVPESNRSPTPPPRVSPPEMERAAEADVADPGPPPRPPAIDAESLEREVSGFNARQHHLYRVLRVEIGAGADVFLRCCLKKLAPAAAQLFEGIGYSPAGRWEEGALRSRLQTLDAATVAARLEAAIEAQVQELARTMDEERAAGIKRDLANIVRGANDGTSGDRTSG